MKFLTICTFESKVIETKQGKVELFLTDEENKITCSIMFSWRNWWS